LVSPTISAKVPLGIRRGEALALRWQDIGKHPQSNKPAVFVSRSLCQVKQTLHFKGTKTGGQRWVELPASVSLALDSRRKEQAAQRAAIATYDTTADLIFGGPFGEPLKPDSVSSKVSLHFRRLKMAGSLHTLRHSHGSQLIADGADIASVSARLGHADAGTTLGIYTRAIPGKSDLAAKWEEIQGKKPQ
jgi:integrase